MMLNRHRKTANEARRYSSDSQSPPKAGRIGVIPRCWVVGLRSWNVGSTLHRRPGLVRACSGRRNAWLGHVRQTYDRAKSWTTRSALGEEFVLVVLAPLGRIGGRARRPLGLLSDISANAGTASLWFADAFSLERGQDQ